MELGSAFLDNCAQAEKIILEATSKQTSVETPMYMALYGRRHHEKYYYVSVFSRPPNTNFELYKRQNCAPTHNSNAQNIITTVLFR